MIQWVKATTGEFVQVSQVLYFDANGSGSAWSVAVRTTAGTNFTVADGFSSEADANDQIRAWLGSILEV